MLLLHLLVLDLLRLLVLQAAQRRVESSKFLARSSGRSLLLRLDPCHFLLGPWRQLSCAWSGSRRLVHLHLSISSLQLLVLLLHLLLLLLLLHLLLLKLPLLLLCHLEAALAGARHGRLRVRRETGARSAPRFRPR